MHFSLSCLAKHQLYSSCHSGQQLSESFRQFRCIVRTWIHDHYWWHNHQVANIFMVTLHAALRVIACWAVMGNCPSRLLWHNILLFNDYILYCHDVIKQRKWWWWRSSSGQARWCWFYVRWFSWTQGARLWVSCCCPAHFRQVDFWWEGVVSSLGCRFLTEVILKQKVICLNASLSMVSSWLLSSCSCFQLLLKIN